MPSFISSANTTTGTAQAVITPATATGVLAGDLIMIYVSISSGTGTGWADTSYSGWTILDEQSSGTTFSARLLYRFATGSGDAPPTVNITPSGAANAVTSVYRGVSSTSPFIAQSGSFWTTTRTQVDAPTLTNTDAGAFGVYQAAGRGVVSPQTWTPGTGLIEREDFESGTASPNNTATILQDTNGTVGTGNVTYSATLATTAPRGCVWAGLLRPASGAPTTSGVLAATASTSASVGGTVTTPAAPPAMPTRGLRLYLEADSLNLTNGAAVTSWADKTASGITATQAVTASQPVYRPTGLNGRPSVQFDGVDDNFDLSSGSGSIFQNAGEGTIVTVSTDTNVGDTVNGHQVVFFSRNTTATRFAIIHNTSGQYQIAARRLDADTAVNITGGTVVPTALEISQSNWNAGTGQHYTNGVLDIDTTLTSAGLTSNTAGTNNQIGMQGNATNYFPGHIALVAVYNVILTPAERLQVGNYVQSTYGISIAGLGQSATETSTAAASMSVGAPTIARVAAVNASAAGSVTDAGARAISSAESATGAASAAVGTSTFNRVGALSAGAAATNFWVRGATSGVPATGAATATLAGAVTRSATFAPAAAATVSATGTFLKIGSITMGANASGLLVPVTTPTLAATGRVIATTSAVKGASDSLTSTGLASLALGGTRLTQTRTLTASAASSFVNAQLLLHSYVITARSASSVIDGGFFTQQLKKSVLVDFFTSGTLAPRRERFSTVLVVTDVTGDSHSITGMQAVASVDFTTSPILRLGPPARFNVDVDASGRFSVITELSEVVQVETNATGQLRVIQSLTTILEEGLPALLTPPSVVDSAPAPEPTPQENSIPVYSNTFFGTRL